MSAKQVRSSSTANGWICSGRRVQQQCEGTGHRTGTGIGTGAGAVPRRAHESHAQTLGSAPLIDVRRDEVASLCAALIDPQRSAQH